MTDSTALHRILAAKEERARRQKELIREYKTPLVIFSLNIPGPDKNRPDYTSVFQTGLKKLKALLETRFPISFWEVNKRSSGSEAMFALSGNPLEIKRCCAAIEQTHPLGRLLDIDVLGENLKKISRIETGMLRRKCLLCSDMAFNCMVSKKHSLNQLNGAIAKIIENYYRSHEA